MKNFLVLSHIQSLRMTTNLTIIKFMGPMIATKKAKTNLIVMVRNVSIYQCMSSGYKEIDKHFHYALRGYCNQQNNHADNYELEARIFINASLNRDDTYGRIRPYSIC